MKRDLKVVRDGDVRVPCDMLFQADVAEAANARLLCRVAWLTRGMARSVVDDDRIAAVVDWLVRPEILLLLLQNLYSAQIQAC